MSTSSSDPSMISTSTTGSSTSMPLSVVKPTSRRQALFLAVQTSDVEAVKGLLALGVSANERWHPALKRHRLHARLSTPLHALPYDQPPTPQAVSIFRALLTAGADVNAQDQHRTTPLYKATQGGHLAWVDLLLEAGAVPFVLSTDDPSAPDPTNTPLLPALAQGHLVVVERLLQHGAPWPLPPALHSVLFDAVQRLQADTVEYLLQSPHYSARTQPFVGTMSHHPLFGLKIGRGATDATRHHLSSDQAQAMTRIVEAFLTEDLDPLFLPSFDQRTLFSFFVEHVPNAPLSLLRTVWDHEQRALHPHLPQHGITGYSSHGLHGLHEALSRRVQMLDLEALQAFQSWDLDLSFRSPLSGRSLVDAVLDLDADTFERVLGAPHPVMWQPSQRARRLWDFLMTLPLDLNQPATSDPMEMPLVSALLMPKARAWLWPSLLQHGANPNVRYANVDLLVWVAPLQRATRRRLANPGNVPIIEATLVGMSVAESLSLSRSLIEAGASPLSRAGQRCLTLFPMASPSFLRLLWSRLDLHPTLTPEATALALVKHLACVEAHEVPATQDALQRLIEVSMETTPFLQAVWPHLLAYAEPNEFLVQPALWVPLARWALQQHAAPYLSPTPPLSRPRL